MCTENCYHICLKTVIVSFKTRTDTLLISESRSKFGLKIRAFLSSLYPWPFQNVFNLIPRLPEARENTETSHEVFCHTPFILFKFSCNSEVQPCQIWWKCYGNFEIEIVSHFLGSWGWKAIEVISINKRLSTQFYLNIKKSKWTGEVQGTGYKKIQQDRIRYNTIRNNTKQYKTIQQDTIRCTKRHQDTPRYNHKQPEKNKKQQDTTNIKIHYDKTRYNKIQQDTTRYTKIYQDMPIYRPRYN